MIPSVFVTAKHYNPGLKRDAASIWIEDVTQSSCKVCLRELQNYAGSHQDVVVVSNANLMQSNEQRFSLETKCSRLVSFSISSFGFYTLPAVGPAEMHDFLLENIFPSIVVKVAPLGTDQSEHSKNFLDQSDSSI